MRKILYTLFVIAVMALFAFTLSGYLRVGHRWDGIRPCDQPESNWVSEKNDIYFSVLSSGAGKGTIYCPDGEVKVHVSFGMSTDVYIYYEDDVCGNTINGPYFEYWDCEYLDSDSFIATVKESAYFKAGEEILFKRVEQ